MPVHKKNRAQQHQVMPDGGSALPRSVAFARDKKTGMNAGDYFMICFVFAVYAIGPLLAAFLVRRINRSDLFDDHND